MAHPRDIAADAVAVGAAATAATKLLPAGQNLFAIIYFGFSRPSPTPPHSLIGHTKFVFLYSFGEFRSISFAFGHLLIKWPTTLQVANVAAVAAAVAAVVLLLLLLLSSSFRFSNCLTKACGTLLVTVLLLSGAPGRFYWAR